MSDVDWRLIRELTILRDRFREIMERAVASTAPALSASPRQECLVDIWETDTEIVVQAELPGARREDIELRLEGDTLVMLADLPGSAEDCGRFLHVERRRGTVRRMVKLPSETAGEPRADLRDGVLDVRFTKAHSARIRVDVQEG